jgi:hypothetical protein
LAGGFGVAVTAVFIGIYLTGLVLIGPDEPEAEAVEAGEAVETVVAGEDPAEPYPDDEETETSQTDTDGDSDSDSDESLESSESSRS